MKVLLVNPTGSSEEEYGAMRKASTELPQLGLAAIAASLLQNNHEVRVIDMNIDQHSNDSLLGHIKKEDYDIVGFSIYVTTLRRALLLSKMVKQQMPEKTVIIGGPHVTLYPDDAFSEDVDYIFLGEADHSILELIEYMNNGNGEAPQITGLLKRVNGEFKGDTSTNLVKDMNVLPKIELDKMYDLSRFYPPVHIRGKKVMNVIGTRGCPYKCTFCAVAEINGVKLRKLTPENFIDQLEYFVKQGYDSFIIYDDTFTIDRKRAAAIAKEILARRLNIKWNCFTRVDLITPELLDLMKESGCYHIMFGCESFNEKTVQKLKKGFTVEQSYKGIEMTNKAGIMAASSFMLGLPGETKEDMLHTIHEVCRLPFSTALFPIFEPYKGTNIYDDCKNEGKWIKSEFKNNLLTDQEEIWVPDTCSREEIEELAKYAFQSFYLRPGYIPFLFKLLYHLPASRKVRFMNAGFDYFFLSRIMPKKYSRGSRYR